MYMYMSMYMCAGMCVHVCACRCAGLTLGEKGVRTRLNSTRNATMWRMEQAMKDMKPFLCSSEGGKDGWW